MAGMVEINPMSDEQIISAFGPGAVNLTQQRAQEIRRACIDEAPEITGFLKDNIRIRQVNYRNWRIVSEAPYSMFVIDGRGPEGPRRPNRYMNRGLDRVAALHG